MEKLICKSHPVFCFRYLTTNNDYDFTKMTTEQKCALLMRLKELSSYSWTELMNLPKEQGLETIKYERLNFSIPNNRIAIENNGNAEEIVIKKTDKIFVFRFNNEECRMLGYKRKSCAILHIIGFDLDHSAYNHGR